ncbi:iron-sulfur cluster carrier protein ApbC [Parapusillimonas granuli]|uniref:Iron-sulfur cluster carrier protein n=1 Tax=Parapusillimonas granuli TaxID=380911 RepID=A0A853FZS6_9BURK|nr:iron-sulfur cluster carrier protein ApbC [Parapusillimonas granuli]MEB2398395.1 iron-sulfur cluster carrier protein ApbC [Alcaligenaceae bacterium]NYT49587.1 iron-sulfur cluster carrier protein ApbC [Parapusillimonas granuli]
MSLNPEQVLSALSEVTDPGTKKKLPVTAKNTGIEIEGDTASITVPLGYPLHNGEEELRKRIETALARFGAKLGALKMVSKVETHAVQQGLRPLPGVRNIIAVASGKGGVGKSTTAVNVALALAAQGARVGLVDADIYGPSVPIMLGLSGRPRILDDKRMEPLTGHGLQANSIGFLIDSDAPAIWRGPMATQALLQLVTLTAWSDLDYLIVDMPPGTGDIALTLAQKVPLTGAVIVTTPQDLALADALKGLKMFQKVNVPVLGIVENMSVHICTNCGHAEPIFGEHGGRNLAAEQNLPWLGSLPLQLSIRTQTDSGRPTVVAEPNGEAAAAYHEIAQRMAVNVASLPRDMSGKIPTVVARKT